MASGVKFLPGFFEMWLRDQAAALMGQQAEENWRTFVRQETKSDRPKLEGLSQQQPASQQQQLPPEVVLDGATCTKADFFSTKQCLH